MHQPQVARLLALPLAILLVLPVARGAWSLLLAGAFLVEFLTAGDRAPLTWLTPPPVREPLHGGGLPADRYRPALPGRALVLAHGYTPAGKDDPRARHAAGLLARAGLDVLVPTLPGLTAGRLRPADAEAIVAAVQARPGPTAILAVSLGAGPALLAAADPRVRDRIDTVVCLGGYASATELLRFFLTGEYAYGEVRGRVAHDPAAVRAFLGANADLLDEPLRSRVLALEPAAVAAVLADPPPRLRRTLEALSPLGVAGQLQARLVLVHGRDDRAVPFTESLRLQAARPARTRVVLLGAVDHVEGPGSTGRAWGLVESLTLWGVVYALLAGG